MFQLHENRVKPKSICDVNTTASININYFACYIFGNIIEYFIIIDFIFNYLYKTSLLEYL